MVNPLEYRAPDRAESRTASRRIIFCIAIGVLSVIVVIVAGVFITIVAISRRLDENLQKADNYIAGEQPILAKDHRFQNVELESYTASGGSVYVGGKVGTQAECSALRRIIDTSAPPVHVHFSFQVLPTTNPSTVPVRRAINP